MAVFVCLSLWGCASVPPRLDEMRAQTAGFQLPKLPEEGKALVYVVNPSTFVKYASKHGNMYPVYLDNHDSPSEVGATFGQQYTYFSVTPGEHKIFTKADNWAELDISAKAGDVIFLKQEPYMGFTTLNIRLDRISDDEGKYYIKTLPRGKIIANQTAAVTSIPAASNAPRPPETANTYRGTITGGNFAKGIGFSNINIKLEVTDESGVKEIFFVRSDSKVFDVEGKQTDYISAFAFRGKKVSIEYFTIEDATGGDPTRSDFAYEIGHKGVRVLRLLDQNQNN